MEHKGSSNSISAVHQAVILPFLEPDNVDLEMILHWEGSSSALAKSTRH